MAILNRKWITRSKAQTKTNMVSGLEQQQLEVLQTHIHLDLGKKSMPRSSCFEERMGNPKIHPNHEDHDTIENLENSEELCMIPEGKNIGRNNESQNEVINMTLKGILDLTIMP